MHVWKKGKKSKKANVKYTSFRTADKVSNGKIGEEIWRGIRARGIPWIVRK